jgi:hypothetical protein
LHRSKGSRRLLGLDCQLCEHAGDSIAVGIDGGEQVTEATPIA